MEIIPFLKHPIIEQINNCSMISKVDKFKAIQDISRMILNKEYANSVRWNHEHELLRAFNWSLSNETEEFWVLIYYKLIDQTINKIL